MRDELKHIAHVKMGGPAAVRAAVSGQPILVRSNHRQFVLIAADRDAVWARRLVTDGTIAETRWELAQGLQDRLNAGHIPVKAVLDAPLNHANRALAKVALTFLAHCIGDAAARLPLFHAVRRVVLNNEPNPGFLIDMDVLRRRAGGSGLRASDAHVLATEVFEANGDQATAVAATVLQPGKHVLLLGATSQGLFAFLSLAGRAIAVVPLLERRPGFDVRGILGGLIVDPARAAGDEVRTLSAEKRSELMRVLSIWAASMPQGTRPPEPVFVYGERAPFLLQFTYAGSAGI